MRCTKPMIACDSLRDAIDDEEQPDERRSDPRPHEAPAEAERAEDDEDDDADDVGHTLGDDDGRRARDGDAVRLEEDERLEDLARPCPASP